MKSYLKLVLPFPYWFWQQLQAQSRLRVLLTWIAQRESRLALMQSLSRHGLCQRPHFQHFARTASREDKLNY